MATVVPIVARSGEEPDPDQVLAVVDLDEFEQDRRDAKWQAFLKKARERRVQLRLEQRIR